MKICVCGKGGSGKSTVATLLAGAAQEKGFPALVFDADESNSGLYRMLGFKSPPVPLMELVGGKAVLKEKMKEARTRHEDYDHFFARQRTLRAFAHFSRPAFPRGGCILCLGQ